MLTATLQYRPVVMVVWAFLLLLIYPFYMFSNRELAPTEDQSIVFGIVQSAPNATLDQTTLFTGEVNKVFQSFPETKATFQITFPSFGFCGMVTKPWSEREKSTEQLYVEASGGVSKIPGIRVIPIVPPALPGGGSFPVDMVIASTAEPEQLVEFANTLVGKAFGSGMFMYADTDLKFDQPQAEVVFNRDKLRAEGVSLAQAGLDPGLAVAGHLGDEDGRLERLELAEEHG